MLKDLLFENKEKINLYDIIFSNEEWKPSFNKKFIKDLGYEYVGSLKHRTGGDFFVDTRDSRKQKTKSDVKKVIKNIDNIKNTFKDPPAVGISLPKSMRG